MKGRRIQIAALFGLILMLMLAVAGAAPAQAHSRASSSNRGQTTQEVLVEALNVDDVFVPCALGGIGEYVRLSGNQVYQLATTDYPSGAFRIKLRIKYDGVVGLGLTSGEPYKATSKTKLIESGILPYPFDIFYKSKLKLKGLISKTKFRTYESLKIAIDADGVATTSGIGPLVDCRSKSQPDYRDDD